MVKKSISQRKVRMIILSIVRLLLIIAFLGAWTNERWLVLFISSLAFLITFLPVILHKVWSVKIPAEFEAMVILFIYGTLFFGEVRGFYAEFWWWGILLNMTSAIALGFVGLAVMFALYKEQKIKASPLFIAFFAFCFSVAIGSVWEIFEFSIDKFFGFNLQNASLQDTMKDMIVNSLGAFIVSLSGYIYIKKGKVNVISRFVTKFVERNPKLFKTYFPETPEEKIKEMVKKGEHKHLEFKSSLRTNLHTNQTDKKIEHATLKTIAAYLNSGGGTLLVGVNNNGEIIGTEVDKFENDDRLNLHFTNMIRYHIGNEYLPFIQSEIIRLGGKTILKIDCAKSHKHVFLKMDGEEEFYVRNGPASVKLTGSALIDYINNMFRED